MKTRLKEWERRRSTPRDGESARCRTERRPSSGQGRSAQVKAASRRQRRSRSGGNWPFRSKAGRAASPDTNRALAIHLRRRPILQRRVLNRRAQQAAAASFPRTGPRHRIFHLLPDLLIATGPAYLLPAAASSRARFRSGNPAARRSTSTLSVFSHGRSRSVRPKCP